MKIQENELFNGRYRLISEKGRGAFGEVWLAHDEQTDMDVAVKIYIALDDNGIDEFRSEYKTAYALNHPNLLHANYFDIVENRPFLVMPYCPESAESLIGTTDEGKIWKFIKDVAAGLSYLHSKNILHRDIKPDNVLADAEGNYMITDFGVSAKMKSTLRRNSTRSMADADISGTIGYMAPELFSKTPEAVKATDIWAFGATLFEIINGELPFYGQGGVMLEHGAEIPELKGNWSEALRQTVEACLAKDPWNRPTAEQLEVFAAKCFSGTYEKAPWKVIKTETSSTASERASLSMSERIEICRTCRNRKHDIKTGLYCGLTGQKPDFKSRCNNLDVDQEEYEIIKNGEKEVQNSIDKVGGWTAFFLWCGIGLGLIISIVRTLSGIGIYHNAILICYFFFYLALFLLIGVKAIAAFYKKQENAVPLATTYCIMIALDAATLLVVNLIIKDNSMWIVFRNILWSVIWLTFLYCSEDIKNKFPKGARKWHTLEKSVLTIMSVLSLMMIILVAIGSQAPAAQHKQTPVVKTVPVPKPKDNQKAAEPVNEAKPANTSKAAKAKKETVPADDNATKLNIALAGKDYATVKALADGGYSPAYLPLAQYYLLTPSTHDKAEKYAQKAKRAGVTGAQGVLDDLEAMGYYD